MSTPDPTSFAAGRAIVNPENDPQTLTAGATYPSYTHPITQSEPKTVPGLTIGFSAQATQSTILKLPFVEVPLVAFTLAVITGILNAFTLIYQGTFATVQAGNILIGGLAAMIGDWSSALTYLLVILLFALGAFFSAIFISAERAKNSKWMTAMLIVLGVLTAIVGVSVLVGFNDFRLVVIALAFIAGIMSNAYRTDNNMLFGALAVTFLIQMTASFLARALFRREGLGNMSNIKWSGVFASVLLGFVVGALGGTAILVMFGARGLAMGAGSSGGWVLVIAAALFFVLAAFSKRTVHEGESVRP